jgi:CubicO group peptidase (beta-lactamase class C family)
VLVAKVSGYHYTTYLQQEIYQPLGLMHTGVSVGDQPN